jgi:prepilin-type processing-associated H-X9-DG protein/prepilin-type N-terminal cleavage/methylation domain-containing protein
VKIAVPRPSPVDAGKAFTLVELLVALVVIGILIGILLPAVQMAREAARRGQCSNNLRQLGIALSGYATATGVFPPAHDGGGYSPHVMILPFLEQKPLHDSLNFEQKSGPTPSAANLTVAVVSISVFLCPSDSGRAGRQGGTNCAGNTGVGFDKRGHKDNGLFVHPWRVSVSYGDVNDGTSNTSAMAEWLLGPTRFDVRDARRSVFDTSAALIDSGDVDRFAVTCQGLNIETAPLNGVGKGTNWLHGDVRSTLYNHTLPVNDHSCTNGNFVQQGAWTAGSQHPRGANVLFADGHVRFLVDSVALSVWRALGTRNGGEAISDSY